MELANNAIHIYNQGIEFRRTMLPSIRLSTRCVQLAESLSHCVAKNKLNVLDGEGRTVTI